MSEAKEGDNGIDIYLIIDSLNGTSLIIDNVIEDTHPGKTWDDLSSEQFSILDDNITCCECCGWWVDTYEIDSNRYCRDCAEQEDDFED